MTPITPRVLGIDWSQEVQRHWNGGNAAATHAFNALSLLFPDGERYFVEVAREVARAATLDKELAQAVDTFIAQESIHGQQHQHYNSRLREQGFDNVVDQFVLRWQALSRRHFSPLSRLAVVCAYEHYTAILGDYILRHPQALASAQPEMALIWGWHSAEETEHKAVCFDLYKAADGGWTLLALMFVLVSLNFGLMFGRLYVSLLHRDGCLQRSRLIATGVQAMRFFFGRTGVGWHLLVYGCRYLRPGFHPWEIDNRQALSAWIKDNQSKLRTVGT